VLAVGRTRSVGVRERRAELVGKQNGKPELFDRRVDDASRSHEHKLTVNITTVSDEPICSSVGRPSCSTFTQYPRRVCSQTRRKSIRTF
jgi:hypothetical protein